MKTFLRLSLASAALGMLVPFSQAQDETVAVPVAPTVEAPVKRGEKGADAKRLRDRVESRDQELAAKLNLSATQKEQLAALRKQQAEQLRAVRGDRSARASLMKKSQDEVRALLTEEQRQKFESLAAPRPERIGKRKKAE